MQHKAFAWVIGGLVVLVVVLFGILVMLGTGTGRLRTQIPPGLGGGAPSVDDDLPPESVQSPVISASRTSAGSIVISIQVPTAAGRPDVVVQAWPINASFANAGPIVRQVREAYDGRQFSFVVATGNIARETHGVGYAVSRGTLNFPTQSLDNVQSVAVGNIPVPPPNGTISSPAKPLTSPSSQQSSGGVSGSPGQSSIP